MWKSSLFKIEIKVGKVEDTAQLEYTYKVVLTENHIHKASVTIMADFSPEFNPPFRWRSKHQTKKDC